MDFKVQTNQPNQQAAPANRASANDQRGNGGTKIIAIVAAVVMAIVLAACAFMLVQGKSGNGDAAIENDKYQAVFMSNGQVYFGKLSNLDAGYAQLKDIYYLQVQQPVQPAAEKKDSDQPQVSLTKLGKELHGPTDQMHISRDQILFWENLRDDSTVVKAIKNYQNKQ